MEYSYNGSKSCSPQYGTKTIPTETTATGIELSKFFIDYHSHSEQLVDALKEWMKRLRFTTCRYENGFHLDNAVEIPPSEKGFMAYMIKHLQKEQKYKPILSTAFEIEDSRKNLCKQIEYLLVNCTPISTMPSFQKIILDKIQSVCPTLTRCERDDYLQQDNMFLYVTIFRVIFDTVYHEKSSILLSERPLENNRSQLWYGNEKEALGQGDTHVIAKLRKVIEDLVTDNSIKKRIEEYKELHKQLSNYERIDVLKDMTERLWTYVHGGGLDACELCDPHKLAPRPS